jgi:hypothetical protein
VGSFLPLLTLCLLRYRELRENAAVRRTVLILIGAFVAVTLWELAPVPAWIGRILAWDRGDAQRWLFMSGFLLILAALSIWSNKLISATRLRIGLFVLVGPVAAAVLKFALMIHKGDSFEGALYHCRPDILLCGVTIAMGAAAWSLPEGARGLLLLFTVAMINVYAFGRFNPLQPAGPIFDVPETDVLHNVRAKAAGSLGGVLIEGRWEGATLNGLGFRSVAHVLMRPQLALFRSYFPAMDAERFNQIFNRYAHIQLREIGRPESPQADVIQVPVEVFMPVRNARRVLAGSTQAGVCSLGSDGGVDRVSSDGAMLVIDGWAPWKGEVEAQGVRVMSARAVSASVSTVTRPDIAERFQDYGLVKSGFELRVSSGDGKAIRAEEVMLVAFGTMFGEVRLACCGCP